MRDSADHPRFLITRLSALGDCILTMPVLCALRSRFPEAKIFWLIQPEWAPLLEGHSDLDDVILVNRNWLTSPAAMYRIRERLRSLRLDVVIDPQSLMKSSVAGWLPGAGRRIGLAPPVGREVAPRLNNELVPASTHIIDRYLGLLRPLGVERPEVRFNIPVHAESGRTIARFLQRQCVDRFAIINPGAGWASRRWPLDRFVTVARFLKDVWNVRTIVIWHGKPERRMARQITDDASGSALPAPAMNLRELAALCRAADLFIGSDSGPLHLAAAVGASCIGLFGTTRAEENGPIGAQHVALQEFYQDGSSRHRRRCSNDAMRAISVDRVLEACHQLLTGRVSGERHGAADPHHSGGTRRQLRSGPSVSTVHAARR
jgi:lipopolysaccharide heptosyltransferase I